LHVLKLVNHWLVAVLNLFPLDELNPWSGPDWKGIKSHDSGQYIRNPLSEFVDRYSSAGWISECHLDKSQKLEIVFRQTKQTLEHFTNLRSFNTQLDASHLNENCILRRRKPWKS
jgi:hypothetical protein